MELRFSRPGGGFSGVLLLLATAGLVFGVLSAPERETAQAASNGELANDDCDALVPPGLIAFWLKSDVPAGWKKLNGSSFSASTYPKLHVSLQESSGYSSGTLPNFSGRWLVGKGSTSSARAAMRDNNSAQAVLGEQLGYLTGAPQSNSTSTGGGHSFKYGVTGKGGGTSKGRGWRTDAQPNHDIPTTEEGAHTHPITGGDSATRPPSVVGHWLIKADHQGACTSQSLVPVGLVVATTSSSTPSGWLSMTGVSTSGNSGLESYFAAVSALDRQSGKTPNWNGRYLSEWRSGWQQGQKLSSQTKSPRLGKLTSSSGGAHSHNIGTFKETAGGGKNNQRRANANSCSSSNPTACNNPISSNPNVTDSQSNGTHTISGDSITRPDSLTVRWIIRGDYEPECRTETLLPQNSVVARLSSSAPSGWTALSNAVGQYLVQTGDHAGSTVNSQISQRTKISTFSVGSPSPSSHTHAYGIKNYGDGISGSGKTRGAAGENSLGSSQSASTSGSHDHTISGWDFTTRPDSVVVNWLQGTSNMPKAECPVLRVSPRELEFGDVLVGESTKKELSLTARPGGNRTATTTLRQGDPSDGHSFGPVGTCTVKDGKISFTDECRGDWTLTPARLGPLAASWDVSEPGFVSTELAVQGNGVQGELFAEALDFGLVDLARPKRAVVTLKNVDSSTSAPVKVTGTAIEEKQAGRFLIVDDKCTGKTLAKGGACDIEVKFEPASIGEKAAVLLVDSDAVNEKMEVSLAGSGAVGKLAASKVDFGEVEVGTNGETKVLTVRNSADGQFAGSAKISQVVLSENDKSAGFSVVADPCSGKLLGPGESCDVQLKFAPKALPSNAGPASGTLTVESDASNATLEVGLSGTGTYAVIDGALDATIIDKYDSDEQLTLKNVGTADLRVTKFKVFDANRAASPNFSIPDPSGCMDVSVRPGKTCSVTVVFDSERVDGSYAAVVEVESNANLGVRSSASQIPVGAITPRAPLTVKSVPFKNPTEIGGSKRGTATIENEGDGALKIERVKVTESGDFRVVNDSDCRKQLKPGDVCDVRMQFDPSDLGIRAAELRVERKVGRDSFLPVGGRAATAVLATKVKRFDATAVGSRAEQKIKVRNVGAAPLRIKKLRVSGNEFSIKQGNCRDGKIPSGESCRATLEFAPRSGGPRAAAIRVTSNSWTSVDQFSVQGIGLIGQLSATIADFGRVPVGDSVKKTLLVRNSGNAPIRVRQTRVFGNTEEFVSEGKGCKIKTLLPKKSCKVPIRFSPDNVGPRSVQVRVTSDGASSPDWIPITGEGIQAIVEADLVDFGSVDVGESATSQAVINNVGDGPLRMQKVRVSDDDDEFVLIKATDCLEKSIKPGNACRVKVRYAPQNTGSSAGILKLKSNAIGSPDSVALAGVALRVKANANAGASDQALPGKVRKLNAPAQKRSPTSAVVTWKRPKKLGSGPLVSYQTRIKKSGDSRSKGYSRWKSQDWVPKANGRSQRKFAKLRPNQSYSVQVRAVTTVGSGPKATVTFTAGIPTQFGTG